MNKIYINIFRLITVDAFGGFFIVMNYIYKVQLLNIL